jgi:hypothetical protein
MSYKVEIKVVNDEKYYPNGIALATREEAEEYGKHKLATWMMADEYRVIESTEPVNYTFAGELLAIEEAERMVRIKPNDEHLPEFEVTLKQAQAIKKVFMRNADGSPNLDHFRGKVTRGIGLGGCVMLPWCGMWLGIEPDGYTHS